MITLQDLVIGYQNNPLCCAISGQITQGSLTAIVGCNGSGKTTFSKTLCGLLAPIEGSINCSIDLHKNLAWLPQRSHIDRDFPINVYEVVAMGCWPRKGIIDWLSSDKKRMFTALEQVGISHLASVSINSLSGGEFQRMLFARMLVQDLPVMLMDEPFAAIDEQTQQLLLALIMKLHKQGKTIIAVLHDSHIVSNNFTQLIKFKRQDNHQHVEFSKIMPTVEK
ncbi:metal ABC transporter ATP-binding protein [Vibrio artabrorum]|uniref:Metal ABC transporter ATP-binding protein n=1 Tax=Vibrio artabrorum TaxID=446374 RepID=A0ABT8CEI1_9VIBR|nr:metal ABC transporter ATP-binding protein [Vibrio artabrorum]MDN3700132.1 metal ABC transporter ATP-binding protein [Vibrio artabrorum]